MEDLREEYKLQGLVFNFVEPSLNYRYESNLLTAQVDEFVENFSKNERLNLFNHFPKMAKLIEGLSDTALLDFVKESENLTKENKDKEASNILSDVQKHVFEKTKLYPRDALEFFDAYNAYLKKKKTGVEVFFSNVENAKKLFSICLTGELKKINYNISEIKDLMEYDKFLEEVLEDFFLSKRIQKK